MRPMDYVYIIIFIIFVPAMTFIQYSEVKDYFLKNYNINPIQKVSLAFQATGLLGLVIAFWRRNSPLWNCPILVFYQCGLYLRVLRTLLGCINAIKQ